MGDILAETQQQRDAELVLYSGRSEAEIAALQVRDPAAIRIHPNENLTAESFDHLYREFRYLDYVHYLKALSAYTVQRRAKYMRRIEQILGSLRGVHVLDFGCGVGSHGIYCLQKGAVVDFLDVEGPLVQYARWRAERRGLPFRFLPAGSTLDSERYDAAICLDVLEHLGHPVRALEGITESLKCGGVLALEVSVMVKPTSGHFRVSIQRWKQQGPVHLRKNYKSLGGGLYEVSR